jgi:3'-5' exoribonuclease
LKLTELTNHSYFNGVVQISEAKAYPSKTKPGKAQWNLVLREKEKTVASVMWDVPEEVPPPPVGELAYVEGSVGIYKGALQITLATLTLNHELVNAANPEDFADAAPMPRDEIASRIIGHINSIKDPEYHQIVDDMVASVGVKFFTAPASKTFHHNYVNGVSYHTLGMLEAADAMCEFRKDLNRDLLKAGIILHDIKKPEEMDYSLGVVSGYTVKGVLLGHIVMCLIAVDRTCAKLGIDPDSEKITLLQHAIASHHGLLEWGSPVTPKIPEAIALHHIDNADAKVQASQDALRTVSPGELSPKLNNFDYNSLYKALADNN